MDDEYEEYLKQFDFLRKKEKPLSYAEVQKSVLSDLQQSSLYKTFKDLDNEEEESMNRFKDGMEQFNEKILASFNQRSLPQSIEFENAYQTDSSEEEDTMYDPRAKLFEELKAMAPENRFHLDLPSNSDETEETSSLYDFSSRPVSAKSNYFYDHSARSSVGEKLFQINRNSPTMSARTKEDFLRIQDIRESDELASISKFQAQQEALQRELELQQKQLEEEFERKMNRFYMETEDLQMKEFVKREKMMGTLQQIALMKPLYQSTQYELYLEKKKQEELKRLEEEKVRRQKEKEAEELRRRLQLEEEKIKRQKEKEEQERLQRIKLQEEEERRRKLQEELVKAEEARRKAELERLELEEQREKERMERIAREEQLLLQKARQKEEERKRKEEEERLMKEQQKRDQERLEMIEKAKQLILESQSHKPKKLPLHFTPNKTQQSSISSPQIVKYKLFTVFMQLYQTWRQIAPKHSITSFVSTPSSSVNKKLFERKGSGSIKLDQALLDVYYPHIATLSLFEICIPLEQLDGIDSTALQHHSPHLEILKLDGNKFKSLECFIPLPKLYLLNLNDNQLQQLHYLPDLFPQLLELNASSNQIQSIEIVTNYKTFCLKQLDLSNNQISIISITPPSLLKTNLLSLVNQLQVLKLYRNFITSFSITATMAPHWNQLLHLDLGRNQLTQFSLFATDNKSTLLFPKLQELILYENQITNCFDICHVLLHSLYLNGNKITKLIDSSISIFAPTLQYLYLQDNSIEILTENCFEGMIHVKVLNLSFNRIHQLQSLQALKHLTCLQELYLHDNPIYNLFNESMMRQLILSIFCNSQHCSLKIIDSTAVTSEEMETILNVKHRQWNLSATDTLISDETKDSSLFKEYQLVCWKQMQFVPKKDRFASHGKLKYDKMLHMAQEHYLQHAQFPHSFKDTIKIHSEYQDNYSIFVIKKALQLWIQKRKRKISNQQSTAAILIQKRIRGFLTRKKWIPWMIQQLLTKQQQQIKHQKAAIQIQKVFRGYRVRKILTEAKLYYKPTVDAIWQQMQTENVDQLLKELEQNLIEEEIRLESIEETEEDQMNWEKLNHSVQKRNPILAKSKTQRPSLPIPISLMDEYLHNSSTMTTTSLNTHSSKLLVNNFIQQEEMEQSKTKKKDESLEEIIAEWGVRDENTIQALMKRYAKNKQREMNRHKRELTAEERLKLFKQNSSNKVESMPTAARSNYTNSIPNEERRVEPKPKVSVEKKLTKNNDRYGSDSIGVRMLLDSTRTSGTVLIGPSSLAKQNKRKK